MIEKEATADTAEAKRQGGSKITPIKNSDTEYSQGGVFEASKFAKGDGWKGSDASTVLRQSAEMEE